MRVVVAFYDFRASEASDLGDAFWLSDTPINRALAETAWAEMKTHPNSAIFLNIPEPVENDDILERLSDIDLHHPNWSEIDFLGVPLTSEILALIHDCGATAERYADGFKIKR